MATVGSVVVEDVEGGEERKELELENLGEWIICDRVNGIAGIWF
jgi:hypothetical protein